MAAPSSPPPPDIFRLLLALAVGVGDAAGFGEARTGVPGEPGGGNEPSGRLADPAPCPVPVSDGGLAGSADEGRFGRFTVGGVGGVTVILGGLGGRCALAGLPIAMSSRHSKPTLPQLGMCPTANPTCIQCCRGQGRFVKSIAQRASNAGKIVHAIVVVGAWKSPAKHDVLLPAIVWRA